MGDATTSSLEPKTAEAHAPDTPPPPTQEEALVDIEEIYYSSSARFRSAPNPKTATIVFRNGRIDENCDFAADILARTAAQHYETPHHLLDHLWAVLRCNLMPPHNKGENELMRPRKSRPISAVELMHAGFKLTASTAGWFAYMKCQKKKLYFTGELSLSPLILGETMACRLVNLAALESVQATNSVDWDVDGYIVSSYLFMLAMLIIGEEDVHELRKSGILISNFSDAQTLAFFKGIRQHLRAGYLFLNTVDEIHECLRKRKVSIAIRKFVYNNYKTFVTVLSIAGVLIGVFKALYSLKKP
ncbi:hypothetical protein HU200_004260 [Digitaria exilis]|uniref:Transmembrane protein n=1 Tax=Digitaria exilis TaxID=1010633 RepID=A0A835FWH4_9POAL|nr:hypothetical protein HU200_004260 [Digitaria exilis]